jgi:hypothetical protein
MANGLLNLFPQNQSSAQGAAAAEAREARADVAPASIDTEEAGRGFVRALDTGDLETANSYIAAGILRYLRPEQQRRMMQKVRDLETFRTKYGETGQQRFIQAGVSPGQALERGFAGLGIQGTQEFSREPQPKPEKPLTARETAEWRILGEEGPRGLLGAIKGKEPRETYGFEQKKGVAAALATKSEEEEIRRLRAKLATGIPLEEREANLMRQQKEKKVTPIKEERLNTWLKGLSTPERVDYFQATEDLTDREAEDRNRKFEERHKLRKPPPPGAEQILETSLEEESKSGIQGAVAPIQAPRQAPVWRQGDPMPEGLTQETVDFNLRKYPGYSMEDLVNAFIQQSAGTTSRAR